jgi:hypothetical protein
MTSTDRFAKHQMRCLLQQVWRALFVLLGVATVLAVAGVVVYLLASPALGLAVSLAGGCLVLASIGAWFGLVDPVSEMVRRFAAPLSPCVELPPYPGIPSSAALVSQPPPPRSILAD